MARFVGLVINENGMYLRSASLTLRAPELGDLDYLFHIENDTRQWMVSACKVPYSRFQLQQYIETNAHDLYVDRQLRLMIERVDNRQVVGVIDIFDLSPANRRAEMGIIVDGECRNKGYGREALSLLCDYAERVLDLHQLYAYVFEDNLPARQLFVSGGFELTATLPDWAFWNKEYRDVCLYQRLFEK